MRHSATSEFVVAMEIWATCLFIHRWWHMQGIQMPLVFINFCLYLPFLMKEENQRETSMLKVWGVCVWVCVGEYNYMMCSDVYEINWRAVPLKRERFHLPCGHFSMADESGWVTGWKEPGQQMLDECSGQHRARIYHSDPFPVAWRSVTRFHRTCCIIRNDSEWFFTMLLAWLFGSDGNIWKVSVKWISAMLLITWPSAPLIRSTFIGDIPINHSCILC